MVSSDVPKEKMTGQEAHDRYMALQKVERDFRSTKIRQKPGVAAHCALNWLEIASSPAASSAWAKQLGESQRCACH